MPLWCGGMLETGIGRAANVALAALPGFTLPGDTSASDRYYRQDLTAPFVLTDGHLALAGPGIGVEPVAGVLEELTTSVEWALTSGAAARRSLPTAGCQFTGEVIHGHPRRFQRIRELRQQRLQLRIGDHWAWKSRTDMDGDGESSVLTSYQYLRT